MAVNRHLKYYLLSAIRSKRLTMSGAPPSWLTFFSRKPIFLAVSNQGICSGLELGLCIRITKRLWNTRLLINEALGSASPFPSEFELHMPTNAKAVSSDFWRWDSFSVANTSEIEAKPTYF